MNYSKMIQYPKFTKSMFSITLVFSACFSSQLFSQAQSNSTSDVSNIIVLSPFEVENDRADDSYLSKKTSIGRSASNLLDIPTSVAIINTEILDDLNAFDPQQALNVGVSGVTENQSINDDVNIRGFRTSNSLRNGITKPSFKKSPMYDIERIEILKGPGALLLGNNSFLGGAVNLISRKPSDKLKGDILVTAGDHGHIRVAANVSGPLLNKPNFSLNYRATVGGLKGDRFKPNQNEDQQFIGGAFEFRYGPHTSLLINAYHFRDDGFSYYEDFLDATSTDVARLNAYSTTAFALTRPQDPFWNNSDDFIDATFLTQLTENTNLRAFYARTKLIDRRRLVGGGNPGVHADNKTIDRRDLPLDIDNSSDSYQIDILHNLELGPAKLDTTIGVDGSTSYNRQKTSVNNITPIDASNPDFSADAAYFAAPQPGAGLPPKGDSGQEITGYSYYIQENISLLNDRLMISGGLRWFTPGGFNTNFLKNSITKRDTTKYKVHKYGLLFKLLPSLSVYYTEAQNVFTQSGFTDKFVPNDGLGDPLSDQEGILEEFGIKFNRDISETFTLFGSIVRYDMALTNVRTFGPLPGNPANFGVIQSEQDKSKGWEADIGARFEIGPGHADVLFTYFDAKAQTAVNPNLSPNGFVPRKFSFLGKYTWTSGPASGLALGMSLMDQDPKFDRALKIIYPKLIGIFAKYQWNKNWSVQMNLDNIEDKRYIVTTSATSRVMVQEGMQSRVSIRYKW
jgi:outer membrane receptor protein involved in Fe transport